MVKSLPAMQEIPVQSLRVKIPWRREWQPTAVFLLRIFYGQRSLVGCSPWGCKELDVTDQLTQQSVSIICLSVCLSINLDLLGWPKSLFGFFHKILWTNAKEIFGQPNI